MFFVTFILYFQIKVKHLDIKSTQVTNDCGSKIWVTDRAGLKSMILFCWHIVRYNILFSSLLKFALENVQDVMRANQPKIIGVKWNRNWLQCLPSSFKSLRNIYAKSDFFFPHEMILHSKKKKKSKPANNKATQVVIN